MCMERKEVKQIIDESIKLLSDQLNEIKESVKDVPVFIDRLRNYENLENSVSTHEFILRGTDGKSGIVNDIKELKNKIENQSKKIFSLISKIAAFAGTLLGIIAVLKSFNIF